MGIFNTKIFDEFERGFKNLKRKIENNFGIDDGKSVSVSKCPACGAQLKSASSKCEYCGSNLRVDGSMKPISGSNENAQLYKYPVLIAIDDETNGFYAYDIQTDYGTEIYNSVAETLADMQSELQDIVDDNESGFEMWTEEKLMQEKYIQKEINNGAKIKFVELRYVDPKNDPDW